MPITSKVREHGFSRITIVKNDIFLIPDAISFKGISKTRIAGRYIKGEVTKTVNALSKKLRQRGLNTSTICFMEIYLTEELGEISEIEFADKKRQEENNNKEKREKQSIIDEISEVCKRRKSTRVNV